MKMHAMSMIAWFELPKSCNNALFNMIDFRKTAILLVLRALLQIFTFTCSALEIIF